MIYKSVGMKGAQEVRKECHYICKIHVHAMQNASVNSN